MTSNRMLKTRSQIEKEERKNFSQFGQCNAESAGRKHPEPPHSIELLFKEIGQGLYIRELSVA